MAVHANQSIAVQSDSVAFNQNTNTEVDFGAKIKHLIVKTSADVRLGFDAAANASDFLLEAADRTVRISPCECSKLYVLGNSGTGTVYFIASR